MNTDYDSKAMISLTLAFTHTFTHTSTHTFTEVSATSRTISPIASWQARRQRLLSSDKSYYYYYNNNSYLSIRVGTGPVHLP